MIRNSNVHNIFLNGLSSSSVFQIGESNIISKLSAILAVEKQLSQFDGKEGNFNDYPIFRRSVELPKIIDNVNMNIVNVSNDINVGTIKILAVSGDSILHIGTTNRVNGLARIHKIRQYSSEKDPFRP